jgi:membrane-bound metal-dependent hydrolase YbcI (DUF457 family)
VQTYTHGVIGVALGLLIFPQQPLAQLAFAVGAMTPDVVMIPAFALDRLKGRQALVAQGPLLRLAKNLSHSVLLWALLLAFVWYARSVVPLWAAQMFIPFALGGLSHMAVDVFTHGDARLNRQDSLYFWPLQSRPFNIGTWDYRYDHGVLWPLKPFELGVFILCGAVTVALGIPQHLL